MDLNEAIARHRATSAKLRAYAESARINDSTFAALHEANSIALSAIIETPEESDKTFLQKIKYLAIDDAARFPSPPALWQPHGALRLAIWRWFGWNAQNWPQESVDRK